jgi:hypothetical protein
MPVLIPIKSQKQRSGLRCFAAMRRSSMDRAAAALCGEPADQLHFSQSSICGLMQINDG